MEGVSRGRLALRAACLLLVLGVSAPGAEAGDPEKAPPVLVLQADPVRTPGGTLPSLVVSQDGAFLATAGYDNVVRLWEATSGTVLRKWRLGAGHRLDLVERQPEDRGRVPEEHDPAARRAVGERDRFASRSQVWPAEEAVVEIGGGRRGDHETPGGIDLRWRQGRFRRGQRGAGPQGPREQGRGRQDHPQQSGGPGSADRVHDQG